MQGNTTVHHTPALVTCLDMQHDAQVEMPPAACAAVTRCVGGESPVLLLLAATHLNKVCTR
jgi:hypothetical protein